MRRPLPIVQIIMFGKGKITPRVCGAIIVSICNYDTKVTLYKLNNDPNS
jgi:hypothetical protein